MAWIKRWNDLRLGVTLVGCLVAAAGLTSCSYSLSGTALPSDVRTVSIAQFQNVAPVVQVSLSQAFTDALRDKFIQQSRLRLVPRNGDIEITGSITTYVVTPANIQAPGGATASTGGSTFDRPAQNRLTITVEVRYVNNRYPEENWTQSFSNFSDFSASQNQSSAEPQLITEIDEKLTQDIFNKALSNW